MAERARIDLAVKRLVFLLHMNWLEVSNTYQIRPQEDTACETLPEGSHYRVVNLRWNLARTLSLADEDLDKVIVHELVPGLLSTLWDQLSAQQQDKLRWFNERTTEDIARAILAALPELP